MLPSAAATPRLLRACSETLSSTSLSESTRSVQSLVCSTLKICTYTASATQARTLPTCPKGISSGATHSTTCGPNVSAWTKKWVKGLPAGLPEQTTCPCLTHSCPKFDCSLGRPDTPCGHANTQQRPSSPTCKPFTLSPPFLSPRDSLRRRRAGHNLRRRRRAGPQSLPPPPSKTAPRSPPNTLSVPDAAHKAAGHEAVELRAVTDAAAPRCALANGGRFGRGGGGGRPELRRAGKGEGRRGEAAPAGKKERGGAGRRGKKGRGGTGRRGRRRRARVKGTGWR
jgi:hypothetical protein